MSSQTTFQTPLLPDRLPPDPLPLAQTWLQEAVDGRVQPNPNAMTLATANGDGAPSVRVVLLKLLVADPGYAVFFTNYRSRKGREIAENHRVAACLHWDTLGRQIRLEGLALPSPAEESDAYFASRNWHSQLSAWGSDQSQPLNSRDALERQLRQRAGALPNPIDAGALDTLLDPGVAIPRPPHWGGYRIWLSAVELWVHGSARVHDRARWGRTLQPVPGDAFEPSAWTATRLQP